MSIIGKSFLQHLLLLTVCFCLLFQRQKLWPTSIGYNIPWTWPGLDITPGLLRQVVLAKRRCREPGSRAGVENGDFGASLPQEISSGLQPSSESGNIFQVGSSCSQSFSYCFLRCMRPGMEVGPQERGWSAGSSICAHSQQNKGLALEA